MAELKPGNSAALRAGIALVVTVAAAALMMLLFGAAAYPWIKAIHVIAVISWMAGMLYLPRLFVYHSDAPIGSGQSETFKVMEQRLLTVITNPAMVIAWALGAVARLAGRVLDGAVVSRQARTRHRAVRVAWLSSGGDAGLRRRPQYEAGEALAPRQRDPDRADGRNCHPGDCKAVLTTLQVRYDLLYTLRPHRILADGTFRRGHATRQRPQHYDKAPALSPSGQAQSSPPTTRSHF